MALNISIMKREDDGLIIIALKGSLDSETYRELKTKAQKYLDQQPTAMLLDLKDLDYISSMGISTLLEIRKALESKGGSLMMANVPPQIDHVFKIVNALPNLQIFKDIEEADQYFMEIQRRIKEKRG
jgi:anti-sigma B factor antagonist